MNGWKRTDCQLCGRSRCMISTVNDRMAYCFRFGTTFFVRNDYKYKLETHQQKQSAVRQSIHKIRKEQGRQQLFDFGDKHHDPCG